MKISEGKRICLRKLNEKNATEEYCSWLKDPEVNEYLETKTATINELKRYIEEKNKNPDCLFLGIFFKENNKHIGNIKLEPIDPKTKKATLGLLLGDKNYWGRGIATETIELFVRFAFKELGLKEIDLVVNPENKAAIRVYEKAGFSVKRIEKKALKYRNKFYDRIVMSIKNEDIS